jgi:hypothetical protein
MNNCRPSFVEALFKRILIIVLCFGVILLHYYRLIHAGALWRDEISTLLVAISNNLVDVFWNQATDSFPFLFAIFLRFWICINPWSVSIPEQDFWIRMFGSMCGLFFAFSMLWPHRKGGLFFPFFTFSLLIFNPIVVVWGDSLRAYGLGSAFLVLFTYQIRKEVLGDSLKLPLPALVFATLSVWTLYGNIFLVSAVCLSGIFTCLFCGEWGKVRNLILVGAVSCLSLIFNFPVIFRMMQIKDLVDHHIGPMIVLGGLINFLCAGGAEQIYLWFLGILVFLVAAARLVLVRNFKTDDRVSGRDAIFSSLTLVLVIIFHLVYILKVGQVPQVWYFIPPAAIVVFFFDSMHMGSSPKGGRLKYFSILMFILLISLSFSTKIKILTQSMTNINFVVEQISKIALPHDILLVADPFQASTVLRYVKDDLDVQIWPSCQKNEMRSQGKIPLLALMEKGDNAIRPLLDLMQARLRDGGSIWFLGYPAFLDSQINPPSTTQILVSRDTWKPGPFLFCWDAQTTAFLMRNAQLKERSHIFDTSQVNNLEAIDRVFHFQGLIRDSQSK